MAEALVEILKAVVLAALGAFTQWWRSSPERKKLMRRNAQLAEVEHDHVSLVETIQRQGVSKSFCQPVFLAGPRSVGKTTLVRAWYTDWIRTPPPAPTPDPRFALVPFYRGVRDRVPGGSSFLPGVPIRVRVEASLRVWDFPGDPLHSPGGRALLAQLQDETAVMRETGGLLRNLGSILVCLFDAEEAAIGVRDKTSEYYNKNFFARLDELRENDTVALQQLVIVFNKLDLLRKTDPAQTHSTLRARCNKAFGEILGRLRDATKTAQVRTFTTVLAHNSDESEDVTEGATDVRGALCAKLIESLRKAGYLPAKDLGGRQYTPVDM